MITINLRNIESIIFHDKELWKQFPEFRFYFDQWSLAQKEPYLKSMGKQAVIDLLNTLNENHLQILRDYFQVDIALDKISNRIVQNLQFSIDDLQDGLNEMQELNHICLYRNDNQMYISLWR